MLGIFHTLVSAWSLFWESLSHSADVSHRSPEEPSTVPSRELDHRRFSLFLSSALTQDFILGFLEISGWCKYRWVEKRQEGDKKRSTGSPLELRLREMQAC